MVTLDSADAGIKPASNSAAKTSVPEGGETTTCTTATIATALPPGWTCDQQRIENLTVYNINRGDQNLAQIYETPEDAATRWRLRTPSLDAADVPDDDYP